MGTTKTEVFTAEQNQVARLAKALAHPARIAILEVLSKGDCICGQIVDKVPLSQSTISQHLKELKHAGLIQGEISGPRTCYCIDPEQWALANRLFNAVFTNFAPQNNCC